MNQGWRKGPWTPEEDKLLSEYVRLHGHGRWSFISKSAGLNRNGQSCRLRWVNHIRPGLKRGQITPQEKAFIVELHALWGNKWSTIDRYLPRRTDNEIRNYWRTHFKKRAQKSSQKQDKRKTDHSKQKQGGHETMELSQAKAEDRQDDQTAMMTCPTMDQDHRLTQDNIFGSSWSDNPVVEEGLWGGLWNLDDQQHGCMINHASNSFSMGGDPDTFYSGGYTDL